MSKEVMNLKKAILANKGKAIPKGSESSDKAPTVEGVSFNSAKKTLLHDMKAGFQQLDALRRGNSDNPCLDISLAEFVQGRWGFAPTEQKLTGNLVQEVPESFYAALGINSSTTVERLKTLGEVDDTFRWLVPEIFREAVRLGLRKDPIYPNLIRAEENVTQLKVTMPDIKMSNMYSSIIGEGETPDKGTLSFGTKDVKLDKMGVGIDITDEAINYTSLNMIAIALEDAGVLMRMGQDAMAIDTLINGDGSGDSAAVVGVDAGSAFAYKDILRAWIRMQRLGQLPTAMLANESPSIDILLLPEFKGFDGNTTLQRINLKTPIPQSQDFYIHGAMPSADQLLLVNRSSAMVKLNAQALRVETDRTVARQMNEVYISMTTGFATLKRDAKLIIDRSLTFSANGFPAFMSPAPHEAKSIS